MFRILLLSLTTITCLILVQAENEHEHQLSDSTNTNKLTIKRDVRSPDATSKKNGIKFSKKSKRKSKKVRRKNEKKITIISKQKQRRKNYKRPKKDSKKSRNDIKNKAKKAKKAKKNKSRKKGGKNKKKKIKITRRKKLPKQVKNTRKDEHRADDDTCLANIELAMDYEGKQIKNFKNQKKRVEDFYKLINNKAGKKDNFQNTTSYMSDAIGSDKSCNGSSNKTDAARAVSTHATLNNCSSSVESGCKVPSGTFNETELASCETSFAAVTAKNKECYKATTAAFPDLSAACTCWKAAAELVNTTKELKCTAKSAYESMNNLKKACKTSFSDCKKAEDASVGLIQICNGRTTPSTASLSSPSPAPSPGIIISGGDRARTSVELFNPHDASQGCSLPSLPVGRNGHTMNTLEICGGYSYSTSTTWTTCITFTSGQWVTSHALTEKRWDHISWSTDAGILLMGGSYSVRTTEIISPGVYDAVPGFGMRYNTERACAIVDNDNLLVTGGSYTLRTVSRYDTSGFVEDLASLNEGRYDHGCGAYTGDTGEQVFLVTGGSNYGDYNGVGSLSSTELLSSTSSSWTMATNLPRRMIGVRGVTLGGELYMTGGRDTNGDYRDEILQWSGSAWVEVGKMKMARANHAVSTIRLEDEVLQFCA